MIKVTFDWSEENKVRLHGEMRQWCRDTWGKNLRGQPQTWRSFLETRSLESASRSLYQQKVTFFFGTQKQADWFILRWS